MPLPSFSLQEPLRVQHARIAFRSSTKATAHVGPVLFKSMEIIVLENASTECKKTARARRQERLQELFKERSQRVIFDRLLVG